MDLEAGTVEFHHGSTSESHKGVETMLQIRWANCVRGLHDVLGLIFTVLECSRNTGRTCLAAIGS